MSCVSTELRSEISLTSRTTSVDACPNTRSPVAHRLASPIIAMTEAVMERGSIFGDTSVLAQIEGRSESSRLLGS